MLEHRRLSRDEVSQVVEIAQAHLGPGFHWTAKEIETELSTGEFFGTYLNNQLCAFVCCQRRGADVLEITTLATHPDHLRQGIMKSLLRWLIASRKDCREIWLEVHKSNQKARKLYKELGFVESGERAHYYRDGAAAILCTFRAT